MQLYASLWNLHKIEMLRVLFQKIITLWLTGTSNEKLIDVIIWVLWLIPNSNQVD